VGVVVGRPEDERPGRLTSPINPSVEPIPIRLIDQKSPARLYWPSRQKRSSLLVKLLSNKSTTLNRRSQHGGMQDSDVEPETRIDERSARYERRFELPIVIAALLVIPIIIIERSSPGDPWTKLAAGSSGSSSSLRSSSCWQSHPIVANGCGRIRSRSQSSF